MKNKPHGGTSAISQYRTVLAPPPLRISTIASTGAQTGLKVTTISATDDIQAYSSIIPSSLACSKKGTSRFPRRTSRNGWCFLRHVHHARDSNGIQCDFKSQRLRCLRLGSAGCRTTRMRCKETIQSWILLQEDKSLTQLVTFVGPLYQKRVA